MAFTVSNVAALGSVFGNKRTIGLRVTADSAEANITTGLRVVEAVSVSLEKGQTMPITQINKDSTATASNGVIGVSGTSNANIFNLICYGR